MKKILLAIFALLPVLTTFAQTDWSPQTKTFDQYWMLGVRYGLSQFTGDLSNKNFFAKLDKESKHSYELSIGRQFTSALSFKASFSNSDYFSKNRLVWQTIPLDLSTRGNVSEIGVYGTLNLNKFLSKDKATGENWFAYISSGIGFASWRNKLYDEDNYIFLDSVGFSDAGKTTRMTALSVPLTIGANIMLTDGVWFSLEHSIHFVNSDRMDGYIGGYNDKYTTTTFGLTVKLQTLASIRFRRNAENSASYSTSQVKPTKPERRSVSRGMPKSKPELQDYTGYNALLPPPKLKIDTTNKKKPGVNTDKNVWVAAVDSGRVEITGAQKGAEGTKISAPGTEPLTGIVPTYRVQIQASKTYIAVDTVIKKLNLSEKVAVELRTDGWYRYYVGQYTSLANAKIKLTELRKKGIKDAFIVSFKTNERKVVKE